VITCLSQLLTAFLLNNGVEYHLAHLVAALEWLIVRWLWPDLKTFAYVSQFGARKHWLQLQWPSLTLEQE